MTISYPIAIMSFDRPHYLEQVLHSLKAQTLPIKPDQIFLFQDGHRSRNGGGLTDPELTVKCVELFKAIFPGSKTFEVTENLGVALNFARAENYFFTELGAEAAYFFEDDLVLSPHYLKVLRALVDIALSEKRIAYVAAYGDHRAKLAEQKFTPSKLIPMRHKWGFAITRRQWAAQRELIEPYLTIVARNDYRARDHIAIRKYFAELGYGSTGTSQDGMKDVASHVLGTTKIMTQACFGKYIGEIGLHSKSHVYAQEGFACTEMYPDEVLSFVPDPKQIELWIARGRADAKQALKTAPSTGASRSAGQQKGTASSATKVTSGSATTPKAADVSDTLGALDEEFVRAMYRVFLLREPDPAGLASALRQLRTGQSYEDVMRWCLQSKEFTEKHQLFLRTYLGAEFGTSADGAYSSPGQKIAE